jgi:hypothetical protein
VGAGSIFSWHDASDSIRQRCPDEPEAERGTLGLPDEARG